MKLQELRSLIRTEVRKVIKESKHSLKENVDLQGFIDALEQEDLILDDFIEAVSTIYKNAKQGSDMTDDITDELGDFYDAIYDSNNKVLIKAYSKLRNTADESVSAQATAAGALMKLLGVNESKRLR